MKFGHKNRFKILTLLTHKPANKYEICEKKVCKVRVTCNSIKLYQIKHYLYFLVNTKTFSFHLFFNRFPVLSIT